MKWIRRTVLWATLAAIGLLVAVSVGGAFVGVEKARGMFNSIPLAVFWFVLLGLLVLGFVAFRRLIRSPGLLAVHTGLVLVIAGGMYGSDAGHELAAAWLGNPRVPGGFMTIPEGRADYVVRDGLGRQVGELPFRVGLKDFWMDHYEQAGRWLISIDAPSEDEGHGRRWDVIDWVVGEQVPVPFIGATLKVVRYIDCARPVYAEGAGSALEVVQADGKKTSVPAKVGQEISLENPKVLLRISRVIAHMAVRGHGNGKGMAVLDLPDSQGPEALEVEVTWPDEPDKKKLAYAIRGLAMHGSLPGLRMDYVFPEPITARADPASALPAVEVVIAHKDKELRKWLIGKHPDQPVELSLADLLGPQTAPAGGAHPGMSGGAYLILAPQIGPVRDYFSRLVVFEENRQVAEKVIEVNDPLHYGGYHFYQHSYDEHGGRFSVLLVKSDSGLWPVYAGFALLCAGTFWICWVRPAWRRLAGGRT